MVKTMCEGKKMGDKALKLGILCLGLIVGYIAGQKNKGAQKVVNNVYRAEGDSVAAQTSGEVMVWDTPEEETK